MAGIDGFGTQWAMDNNTATFTDVGECVSIDLLDVEVDSIDVSSHDSPSQWREFVAGMKDGGELSVEVNYDPAAHGALWAALGVEQGHRFTLPDAGAATITFDGFVSGLKAQAPYDDKLSATATIKVSGAVTITP